MPIIRQGRTARNQLNTAKRCQIIAALVEGNSINATCRMLGVGKHTVLRLLEDAGCACAAYGVLSGTPDPKHISTSFVERPNLSMQMGMRRFTRLTNGHSKKVENHGHQVALYFMHYNFCRVHSSRDPGDGSWFNRSRLDTGGTVRLVA